MKGEAFLAAIWRVVPILSTVTALRRASETKCGRGRHGVRIHKLRSSIHARVGADKLEAARVRSEARSDGAMMIISSARKSGSSRPGE